MAKKEKYFSRGYQYRIETFGNGEHIFLEGHSVVNFYKVIAGKIKLVKRINERKEFVHYFIFENGLFGFVDIAQHCEKRRDDAIAMDSIVRIEVIPASEYEKLIKSSSAFRKKILESYFKIISSNDLNFHLPNYCFII